MLVLVICWDHWHGGRADEGQISLGFQKESRWSENTEARLGPLPAVILQYCLCSLISCKILGSDFLRLLTFGI